MKKPKFRRGDVVDLPTAARYADAPHGVVLGSIGSTVRLAWASAGMSKLVPYVWSAAALRKVPKKFYGPYVARARKLLQREGR